MTMVDERTAIRDFSIDTKVQSCILCTQQAGNIGKKVRAYCSSSHRAGLHPVTRVCPDASFICMLGSPGEDRNDFVPCRIARTTVRAERRRRLGDTSTRQLPLGLCIRRDACGAQKMCFKYACIPAKDWVHSFKLPWGLTGSYPRIKYRREAPDLNPWTRHTW